MEPVIIKPKQERLKPYIQYFLFFRKTSHEAINYTTFPNNNLCLALYRRNTIQYTNDAPVNHCSISKGGSSLTGRFYGFHKMPFRVDIDGPLDQVCIIFYSAALRAFTGEHYNDLMHADSFFNEVSLL